MKLFFAVAIALTLGLWASDTFAWEVDATKELSDVNYIPAESRFYGQTKLTWASLAGEVKVAGLSAIDYSAGHNVLEQRIGYGINERLQVFMNYENQLKGRVAVEDNGNSDFEGPANPAIGGLYRLLKQETDSINLDLYALYAPDLIEPKYNTTKGDYDHAAGAAALTLGGRAGKKWTNVEMMVDVALSTTGDAEAKDSDPKGKEKSDANSEFKIAYTAQLPLEKGFFAKGRIVNTMVGETESTDSSNEKTKRDAYSTSELALSLVFAPVPEHLVLEAGLGLIGASDYEQKVGTQKQKYREQGGNVVFISALYQF